MTAFGWVGVWLVVGGAVAVVIEGAVAAAWAISLERRVRELATRLEAERAAVQKDVERLRAAFAETERLWRPYGRALGWLRHPLVIALVQSYVRQRAA